LSLKTCKGNQKGKIKYHETDRRVGCYIYPVYTRHGLGYCWTELFLYQFFAPRQEAVRRQVYEQTKSYRQGSVQRLNTLCSQVASADDDHKGLINDVINHEFAEWDTNDVPGYLRSCLSSARSR
jgi:hypothetical protein